MTISRNHTGHRIGACHQRAKLSTEQVHAIRRDRETTKLTYEQLAEKYDCAVSTIRDIVTYRTRWNG